MRRRPPTIAEVRAELVGDSVHRRNLVARLVALVRDDEREKTLAAMARRPVKEAAR